MHFLLPPSGSGARPLNCTWNNNNNNRAIRPEFTVEELRWRRCLPAEVSGYPSGTCLKLYLVRVLRGDTFERCVKQGSRCLPQREGRDPSFNMEFWVLCHDGGIQLSYGVFGRVY
ncbi:hypothetical protein DQ04_25551000, partial [Trypanosoma grayi]|uniref:hypothetical protein n=1 Tax=Trypanosoma grayi TaxID=71804 RepID=UPI0004F47DF6